MNEKIIYVSNLFRYQFFGVPNGGNFWESFGDVTAETNGKFDNPLNNSGGANSNQSDIWVFATDYDGEILWNQFYGGEVGDRVNNTIYNTDFMYMNATTNSINYDVGSLIGTQDSWFVKLKPNNRPEGNDDNATVFEDSELISINVIDNDTDVDGDDLTIYEISTSGSGTININSDEISIDYTPVPNFIGAEVINYSVSDGVLSSEGILKINVITPEEIQITKPELNIPKFFTPNGDGINDTWNIKWNNISNYKIIEVNIYNRYGKILKKLNSFDSGWDGTYDGKLMPPNDYWVSIKLVPMNENKRIIIETSNFSLIR